MDNDGEHINENYNPQYTIHGVTFRFYSTQELKALSVKEISNPETFDSVFQPSLCGLYDPALGPTSKFDVCYTCGQSSLNCPGHMGHIELPLPVLNPVFFNILYSILRATCFVCHRLRVDPTHADLLINQCLVLDHGKVAAVGLLQELFSQLMTNSEDKSMAAQKCREMLKQFADKAIAGDHDDTVPREMVKNVQSVRHELVKFFIRDKLNTTGKCKHCSTRAKPLQQEHKAKIVLMGRIQKDTKTTKKKTAHKAQKQPSISEDEDEQNIQDEGFDEETSTHTHQPPKKKQKVVEEDSGSGYDVTLLTPLKIKEHLRDVWKNDGCVLRMLYPALASCQLDTPVDIFFLDTIPVPPSRYRPVMELNGRKYENAQTSNLCRVLKTSITVREILWEMEKQAAKTHDPAEHVLSTAIMSVPGVTLIDKLNRSLVLLQTQVNCIVDSDLDKISTDKNPGLKQLIEKKEGLFRKNMMGKRVNFAARSVISPDPNINTNEIGIPQVFAKVLTYPTPVTPWNVHKLRQAVINGPKIYPGAFQIITETGQKILLDQKNPTQREAVAKQLLTPTLIHGKPASGTKKVLRHLVNGDVLLINRQPTLHRPSIQAHVARVLPGEKTLRLHYANCKAYNADFDGDEMNAHFPQNEIARSEAYHIASTDYQYLVPKDGTPLAGLIQDHMVSGVSLTIRGRFFNRADYCRLVYTSLIDKSGPFKLLPPAIIKPCRLWSGKQVLSTVVLNVIPHGKPALSLVGKAKVPEKSWIKVQKRNLVPNQLPQYMGESDVVIRQGELLVGVLDKGHYGPTPYGLVHSCYELYGGSTAGKLLTCFGRLFLNFLQWRGFSLGVEDILVTKHADKERHKIIKRSPYCGKGSAKKALDLDPSSDDKQLLTALRSAHFSLNDRQMRELDVGMRGQTNDIQNNIVNTCMPNGLEKLFPDNQLQLMVVSGAKGSSVNCMQISCLLGQIELEGKRPPPMMSGRTLPSFLPYDTTPRAGGFVSGRFLTGIRQQEYFFHCMAGREGLIDTAVKTSRSGYLQRCLIKHLEGIKINYDLTVRDADNSVVQFYYGEDSLDVSKTGYINPKQFPFLEENHHIIADKQSPQEESSKKISRLQHKIDKWHRRNQSTNGKVRQSGFLQFCQQVEHSVRSEPMEDVTPSSRSYKDLELCNMWSKLKMKNKNKYIEDNVTCPDPIMSKFSAYNSKVLPERLASVIQKYTKERNTKSSSLSDEEFNKLIHQKVKLSMGEPGDAVGLLCAQSIGEPSTQMTLNTFHFAGRGEMNVTLGIPRLREVLMVGSRNLKTPAMDAPVFPGSSCKVKAKGLQKKFMKVFLCDVLEDIKVCEWLAIKGHSRLQRKRVFRVRFDFLPRDCYKERYIVSPGQILQFMEKIYIKKLVALIKKTINVTAKSKLLSSGTNKRKDPESTETPAADAMTFDADADDDDDADNAANDGDTTAEKDKKKHAEEHEYDDEEMGEDGDITKTLDEGQESRHNSDDEVDMDLSEHEDLEEELIKEVEAEEARKHKMTAQGRINAVLQLAPEVEHYTFDKKHKQWCEVTLCFPLIDSKVDLLALIEANVGKVVLHEVPGISRCFLGDQQGPNGMQLHLKTEGINMHELFKYSEFLDLNQMYCNNIHVVADTYGIEAASRIIIKEIQAVFAAYGIEVDYRHLSLLADYMTFEGTYKPFNRIAMNSNPSPLQQMSFETTMGFLIDSSIKSRSDNLSSPSAQIVTGKTVTCGTGCHTLLNPIV